MSSKKAFELLELDRVLKVSEADRVALRHLPPRLDFESYLAALRHLVHPTQEELRKRSGPSAGPPFRLSP
jgi:hypothetical protein